MKTFQYRGYDRAGRPVRGLVEASDLKDARERLAHDGVLAERLLSGHTGRIAHFFQRNRFPTGVRSEIYAETAALLDAGLPLSEVISILLKSQRSPGVQSVLAATGDSLKEGQGFAEALSHAAGNLPTFEAAALTSGERTGNLADVCTQLAAFLEAQGRIHEKVITASIYPIIVLSLGLGVALLMLGVMIPQVGEVLLESGLEVPSITRFMIGIGENLWGVILPVAAVLVFGMWFFMRSLKRQRTWRLQWHRFLLRVPLLGEGLNILTNLRFTQTLAFLLKGGAPVVESLILAGKATGNEWTAQQIIEEADSVAQGDRLSAALSRVPVFGGTMQGWLQAGEASGNMAGVLEKASERLEDRWDRYIARALAVVEPVIIILAGICVFLLALSILLPVLSLNKMLVL